MAKKVYVGVNDVARKVKKIYLGVSDVARKVKKGYIGIGGIARPFWSGGELTYYGKITDSGARSSYAATSFNDYALFGGGSSGSNTMTGYLAAFDKSLVRTTPSAISVARYGLAAAENGVYVLFAGGYAASGTSKVVQSWDTSLTRANATSLDVAKSFLAGTRIGNYALFAGDTDSLKVNAYDQSLTVNTTANLTVGRHGLKATTIGNYALFGGGITSHVVASSTLKSTVEAYNASLTRSTVTGLSVARAYLEATSVGDYALFGGGRANDNVVNNGRGYTNSGFSAVVDAYNKSLTRSIPTGLSVGRIHLGATSVGDFALFGGGLKHNTETENDKVHTNVVDVYDASLTRTITTPLSRERGNLSAASVGDYAIFGGGGYDATNTKYGDTDAYVVL